VVMTAGGTMPMLVYTPLSWENAPGL
jgi:hypothetical protein